MGAAPQAFHDEVRGASAERSPEARRGKKPTNLPPSYQPALGKEGVGDALSKILTDWHGKDVPGVRIVETKLQLPVRLYLAIGLDAGVYESYSDTVWLIGDCIFTRSDARRVLAENAVGHYTLLDILADDFPARIRDIERMIAEDDGMVIRLMMEVRDALGSSATDHALAAETIARMAELAIMRPVMKRTIASVRRFLRSLGFRLSFNHPVVRQMIARTDRSRLLSLE